MPFRTRRTPLTITLLAALLLSNGCLERKETITVKPDGAVDFHCTFDGDASEFQGHDALPTSASGWLVTDETSTDENKSTTIVRTASLAVPPGRPLPSTFAAADADAEVSLRFPTTVIREARADGTYYHFKRTLLRRDDARFTTARRSMELDSRRRRLLEGEAQDLSLEERTDVVTSLRQIELDKQVAILDLALASLTSTPQDTTLRIRAAVVAASEAFDAAPAIELLGQPQSEQRDRAIEAAAHSYVQGLADALDRALADAKLAPGELVRFRASLATEQRRRKITETLASHVWETRLMLPGELIASNADRVEDGHAVWEFHAPAIMDTEKVLMATSRVPK